jgi:hypothetical protein
VSSHETYMVLTRDGRAVEALISGPPEGFPLVARSLLHHWTPGAAAPFGILERPATQRGLRVSRTPGVPRPPQHHLAGCA